MASWSKVLAFAFVAAVCAWLLTSCPSMNPVPDDFTAEEEDSPPPAPSTRLFVANGHGSGVLIYDKAESVSGDVVADRTIDLSADPSADQPGAVFVDETRDILYVAVYDGDTIYVYDGGTTVDSPTAADRTITSSSFDGIEGIALDEANDILYVSSYGNARVCCFHSASTANGTVTPDRTLSGSDIANPWPLFLDETNDRLYVGNAGPAIADNFIAVFDDVSTLDGSVTADRTITGTALGAYLTGITLDPSRDLLYAAVSNGTILRYPNAATATGDVTPAPQIGLSGLNYSPNGVFVDTASDRLYVTHNQGSAPNEGKILVFDRASSLAADSTPDRVVNNLTGPNGLRAIKYP